MPILYSACVVDTVFIDWPGDHKLSSAVKQIINSTHSIDVAHKIYDADFHRFHCHRISDSKYVFAVTDILFPIRIVNAFIDKVLASENISSTVLMDSMQFYNDKKNDAYSSIMQEIAEVRTTMLDNVLACVNRHDQLQHLTEISASVSQAAEDFHQSAVIVRRNMCIRHWKLAVLLTIIVVAVIVCICLLTLL